MNCNDIEPTTSNFDILGEDVWSGGKVISLNKDSPVCPLVANKNYSLLVYAPSGSNVYVEVDPLKKIREIELYDNVDDQGVYQDLKLYQINMTQMAGTAKLYYDEKVTDDTMLVILIDPYIGQSQLFANFKTVPKLLEEYEFATKIGQSSRLVIPYSNETLYAAVYSHTPSTYSLYTYFNNKNYQYLEINDPTMGEIE